MRRTMTLMMSIQCILNRNYFSTPNDDNKESCVEEHYFPPNETGLSIEITFQGQKHNAARAFSTFVKLRNDLLVSLMQRAMQLKPNTAFVWSLSRTAVLRLRDA